MDLSIKKLQGEFGEFKFTAGNESFNLKIRLLTTIKRGSISIAAFSNFVAGPKLLSLLEKENKLNIELIGPKNFVDSFYIKDESFSIKDFSDARQKAFEMCKSYSK